MEPRVIPRHEHRISRKMVSPNAIRTLYRLHQKGFKAYLVGGCVRDLLLERTPKDFDIATDATPHQIKRLFRNCRLIGRRFRLAHIHFQDEIIEVATFRKSARSFDEVDTKIPETGIRPFRHIKDESGMIIRDNVFGTPEEDALSRDFTINALFYNIADFSVIDYSTGLNDLAQRLIRPIGDPYVRFTEDPVRMLRAVRFAASHDFTIEPDTWKVLCGLSSTIARVDSSRLYEEIRKTFFFGFSGTVFSLLYKSGLLAALFPWLYVWIQKNTVHTILLNSNLEGLDNMYRRRISPSPVLFFAVLFGPALEEEALLRKRDGIPHQMALDNACSDFMEEIRKTLNVPRRVGSQLRAILALQRSLHRKPPRRPSSVAGKLEFPDAVAYLRVMSDTVKENRPVLQWWDNFLSKPSSPAIKEPSADQTPKRKKRRRRHRNKPKKETVNSNTTVNGEP